MESSDAKAKALRQTAYQIIVASSAQAAASGRGDLWDTGKVASDQSAQVVYGGKALSTAEPVFWRVKIWDQAGGPSAWSDTSHWSMGLLNADDWKAKWIGKEDAGEQRDPVSPYWNLKTASWIVSDPTIAAGDVFYRYAFDLPADRKVVSAIAVLGGDRGGDFYLNGNRMGKVNRYGRPFIHDIAGPLKPGRNVIAVQISRQKQSQVPGLIAAIKVTFDRGDPVVLVSNGSWKASSKPIPGWQQADFNDGAWNAAKLNGAYGSAPWGDVGFSEERRLSARMLRKEFAVGGQVKRATVYTSGLGTSELYLNGAKVEDAVLSPGLTDYDKRVLYVTYDVTRQLRNGANAIGVMLGNGRFWAPRGQEPAKTRSFGTPRLRLQMEIELSNGHKQQVISDETWTMTDNGPVRANNEFDGEEYDARMEIPGWASPGFKGSGWAAAEAVTAPGGKMAAQMAEPLRVTETIQPQKFWESSPGVYIYDMGQNMVGWCRLNVAGPAGTRVTLRHAETLNADGKLYMDNLRSAAAMDTYILKGQKTEEVWEPRFIYHGFRYVELRGYPGKPMLNAIEGRVVHDSMEKTAEFTSSNKLLNQLHKNIYWGVRSNYRSIPTDCPQRDERQGWMGDRSG